MNKKIKNSVLSAFLLMAFVVSGLGFSVATKASSSQAQANASRAYNLYLSSLKSKKTVKKTTKKKTAVKKTVTKKVAKKPTLKKVAKK